MRAYAASKGVPVYMGYNKNVTPYVQKARDEIAPDTNIYTPYLSILFHPSIYPIHPIHDPPYQSNP